MPKEPRMVKGQLSPKPQKKRQSNLELFRIFLMLGIVAHHYVVHSGLLDQVFAGSGLVPNGELLTPNNFFIILLGTWGKIGVNCFLLITGYFMCKSKITLKKFLHLLFEIEFYNVAIYLIFIIFGGVQPTLGGIKDAIFPVNMKDFGFVSCFLIFYLLIPFLNKMVAHLNKKQHLILLLIFLFFFSFLPTLPGFPLGLNYLGWFCVVYFVGSYIRLHLPKPNKTYLKYSIAMSATFIVLVVISLLVTMFVGRRAEIYWFVDGPNKLLAIITAVSLFMLFINIKMKYHPIINAIAASTFGVFLIHDNSLIMRNWLWKDTLKNTSMYDSPWLVLHALLSIAGIFIVCVLIDRARIVLLERPLFNKIDNKIDKTDEKIKNWIKK